MQAQPVAHTNILLDNLGHHARTDRLAAFADGETDTFVHSDRADQFDVQA